MSVFTPHSSRDLMECPQMPFNLLLICCCCRSFSSSTFSRRGRGRWERKLLQFFKPLTVALAAVHLLLRLWLFIALYLSFSPLEGEEKEREFLICLLISCLHFALKLVQQFRLLFPFAPILLGRLNAIGGRSAPRPAAAGRGMGGGCGGGGSTVAPPPISLKQPRQP